MEKKKRKKTESEGMVLKKHVGLIHCENKLTLVQRKICNVLLFNALDRINDCDIHEIPLKKLCSLVGYNSNDSKLIKESVKTLISTVMEWNLLEDSKQLNQMTYPDNAISWHASSLLAGASIKNGVVHYSYSPQIKSVLSSLDIYGRINLFVQAKFNSTYSLVLYENCVRFKNLSQTTWFSLELFRTLMGITHDKYIPFKELKRNVINVAIKEINKKSDIYLEPQFKKSGKNITAIQFLLSENENYKPVFKRTKIIEAAPVQNQAIIAEVLVSEFHLSKTQLDYVLMKYPEDVILEKINLVKGKKKVEHPGAYFLSALKNDYKKKAEPIVEKKVENIYLRETKKASDIVPLKNKYMSYRVNEYLKFIKKQTEMIQKEIHEKFEHELMPKIEIFKFYKKKGLASPFVMSEFIGFIEKHFSHVIGEYLSFDDYITSEEVPI